MTTALNAERTVAVDKGYPWQPMKDCPVGVKVQLLNPGGVAVYGQWNGRDKIWRGWAPLPYIPDWMKL